MGRPRIAKLTKRQEQGLDVLLKHRYSLLYGSSRCLVGDTLVLTDNGYKPIRDIVIGDFVASVAFDEIEYKRVVNKFVIPSVHPKHKVITFDDGINQITCSYDHKFRFKGKYVKADVIARRIVERGSGDKWPLSGVKSWKACFDELFCGRQKQGESGNNEAVTGWRRLFKNCIYGKWKIKDHKGTQGCSAALGGESIGEATDKSFEPRQNGQQGGKFIVGDISGKCRLDDETRTADHEQWREKRNVKSYRRHSQGHSDVLLAEGSHTGDACREIWDNGSLCEEYSKQQNLAFREISENSMVIYHEIDDLLFDIEVEHNHNFLITHDNIVSHNSGKTFLAVLFILFRAVKKKSRHVILRYRFSHVKQSIIYDTFPKVCELFGVKYELNKSDWVARLPNGSDIWFGGLDDKDRTEKILGNEYSTIYLNEASQISYNSHVIMLTRLAEKSGLQLRYLCDENPPNKSHWTYKVFIQGVDPETKLKLANAADYGYLKMHIKDNKQNVADGYEEQLSHLPARQRKRFLDGDFGEETMGALWNEEIINRYRIHAMPDLRETVVAVDPAVTSKSTSDKTGILVVGKGFDGRGYVLVDDSGIYTPKEWADKVTKLYRDWDANYIVAESNQGGEMVKHTIKTSDPYVPVKLVHATKGKMIRAEPVSSLYEDGMISHVGIFTDLEDEMVSYTGSADEESPNRLDALVWAVNFLFPVKKDFDAFW